MPGTNSEPLEVRSAVGWVERRETEQWQIITNLLMQIGQNE
jgi:hypothetical protein